MWRYPCASASSCTAASVWRDSEPCGRDQDQHVTVRKSSGNPGQIDPADEDPPLRSYAAWRARLMFVSVSRYPRPTRRVRPSALTLTRSAQGAAAFEKVLEVDLPPGRKPVGRRSNGTGGVDDSTAVTKPAPVAAAPAGFRYSLYEPSRIVANSFEGAGAAHRPRRGRRESFCECCARRVTVSAGP